MTNIEKLTKEVLSAIAHENNQIEYPTNYKEKVYNDRIAQYEKRLAMAIKFDDTDEINEYSKVLKVLTNSKNIMMENEQRFNDIMNGKF